MENTTKCSRGDRDARTACVKVHGSSPNGEKENYLKEFNVRETVNDNPRVRWKDPTAWKCLTDEQRDIINDWWIDTLYEEDKREKRLEKLHNHSSYFALIPFIVFYWMKNANAATVITFQTVLDLLLNLFLTAIGYIVIFVLFKDTYEKIGLDERGWVHRIFGVIVAVLITVFVFAKIYT